MNSAVLIKIDERDPNLSRIRDIARSSREGKIIAFPTETVYGIGGPMSNKSITGRLAEIKNRPGEKAFSFHISDWDMVDFLNVRRTTAFRYLSRKFWPGPLTLLIHTEEGNKIGVRFPRNRLTAALISAAGEPFVGTSANISGQASPFDAGQVAESLGHKIDIILDGGPTELRQDSTIVDLTGDEPVMVREGAAAAEVRECLNKIKSGKFPRKKVLIVCTGNSCRSPMAAGWLKAELAHRGLAEEIMVDSCGIGTRNGMPATTEAVYVMKNREIDISDHRSRVCSREDIAESDVIIAMSKEHYTFITSLMPAARSKIKVLNIMDPIGSPMKVYEKVMDEIERNIDENWDWIVSP